MSDHSEQGAQGVEKALAVVGGVEVADAGGMNGLGAGGNEDGFDARIGELAEKYGAAVVEGAVPCVKRCGCGCLFLQSVEHGGDVCGACAGVLEEGAENVDAVKGVHGGKVERELVVFNFGEQVVRVAGTKEAPLFCVADVCAALELGNPTMAVANHPEEEKGLSSFETVGRGPQKMVCVTEPGLYRLIFRSYKPKAEEFRRWVFREVLPALRHTGNYAMPGRTGEALDLEGRINTFVRVTECLVKLGAKPVAAGNAALRWLPVITAGQLLPSGEEKALDEAEQLFAAVIERQGGEVLCVGMDELVAVANEMGLLQEHMRGGVKSWRTRLGMCLRHLRGAVLETARGQWEVRQKAGARRSEWILRQRAAGTMAA